MKPLNSPFVKTASSVQTAIKGLTEKGILSDNHGTKRPTDLLMVE